MADGDYERRDARIAELNHIKKVLDAAREAARKDVSGQDGRKNKERE